MNINEKFAEARKQKGVSLRQVQKDTGISNAYISQIETGKVKNIAPLFLKRLGTYYKIPLQELFILAGYADVVTLQDVEANE